MFDTKDGPIYEPTTSVTESIYKWLKKHQATLDGSRAYEEMKEIYETLDFDFRQNKRHVG
ncbi:hypothetical protein B5V91_13290 [Heyndrickxia sporothermodurans]|nr:hypothetical protein B5V91_13290 [Heyndrickxia sporothermodurans]